MDHNSEEEDRVGVHEVAERGHTATDIYGNALMKFDQAAETKLRRKIDLFVVPTVAIVYLFCFSDRANIGNARLAGFEKDLNLHGYDYNTVLSIFYVGYIVFELPSTLACKYVGPAWWIPAITYLSRWYRKDELVFRLSCYIVMSPLAGAFGGLLASAILTLNQIGSLHRWQMIFVVEGTITYGLGLIAFFTMTDRLETARWLTANERYLAIARIKAERTASTEVLDGFSTKKILRGILSPVTLVTATIFLFSNVTGLGLAVFLPTVVKTIYPHDSVVHQQLYTVPPNVLGACFVVGLCFISWKNGRYLIYYIVALPLTMIGFAMFLGTRNPHARYGATFMVATSAFLCGAVSNAFLSANVVSDTARAASIGTNVLFGNIGGLVSTWSYLPFDGPNFPIANGLNLACTSMCFILSILLLLWIKYDNRK